MYTEILNKKGLVDKLFILVDGCSYDVELTESLMGDPERITVWDANDDTVGEIELFHNHEHAALDRPCGDGYALNYFEFNEMSRLDIARWIAATAE